MHGWAAGARAAHSKTGSTRHTVIQTSTNSNEAPGQKRVLGGISPERQAGRELRCPTHIRLAKTVVGFLTLLSPMHCKGLLNLAANEGNRGREGEVGKGGWHGLSAG